MAKTDLIEFEVKEEQKSFLMIGTTEIGVWANNGTPFVAQFDTLEDLKELGGDEDEYNECLALQIGEKLESNFEEGIYYMRIA